MAVQLKKEVCTALESSVEELQNIWDYIGYNDPDRNRRAKEVSDRIQKIFFDIIEEENRFRLELETKVEAQKRELAEASQQLGLKPFFPPRGLSTYRLLAVLDEKATELSSLRRARLDQWRELRTKLELYRRRLDLAPDAAPGPAPAAPEAEDGRLPSEDEVRQLQESVGELEEKYRGLLGKFESLREDLVRIAADIDYGPANQFESDVLGSGAGIVENGEGDSAAKGGAGAEACSVPLTSATLEDMQQWRLRLVKQKAMLVGTCDELRSYLRAMWLRLEMAEAECEAFLEANAGYKPATLDVLQAEVDRCQEMKWERSGRYLTNLRAELEQLCASCFVDPASLAGAKNGVGSEDSEDCINALEQEIDRLRELYSKNKTMYDAVASYQRLWEQFLEVEEKMKDPAIFSNRGGILLKTDKEKKRLLKELPRVEQEVAEGIAAFEQQNKSTFLLPGRRTFADYVRALWSEHREGQRSASATRAGRRLKTAESQSPSASPRRKL